jgi:hypothetical protein
MKDHFADMDKLPFDGLVFKIISNSKINFSYAIWGSKKFDASEFSTSLDDLSLAKFSNLTDRFLYVSVVPGNEGDTLDWFDEKRWSVILNNIKIAASLSQKSGSKGLLFDTEQYTSLPFDYSYLSSRYGKSYHDYEEMVFKRGVEFVSGINSEFSNPTIIFTYTFMLSKGLNSDRANNRYGLLANFIDGMLKGSNNSTQFVDGWEGSYGYKERQQFFKARNFILDIQPSWSNEPTRYKELMKLGFGVWLDFDWKTRGWNSQDIAQNYFKPNEFLQSVNYASEFTDHYVWIWSEKANWWKKGMVGKEYIDALEASHKQ